MEVRRSSISPPPDTFRRYVLPAAGNAAFFAAAGGLVAMTVSGWSPTWLVLLCGGIVVAGSSAVQHVLHRPARRGPVESKAVEAALRAASEEVRGTRTEIGALRSDLVGLRDELRSEDEREQCKRRELDALAERVPEAIAGLRAAIAERLQERDDSSGSTRPEVTP